MTDVRLYRVLDSVTARLAAAGADAYWVSMEVAKEIIHFPDFGTEDHEGDAYVLWAEISDLLDAPGGPESPELCRSVAEKAASTWDSVDQSDPEQVAAYFTRWDSRHGEGWRRADDLS
jgi:hypothetical protein